MAPTRRQLLSATGLVTASVCLAACGATPVTAPASTITIAAPSAPADLDPYSCAGAPDLNVLLAAYDTLLRTAPDGTVQAGLATSWQYRSATRFELRLRTGVTFTDGTALDAEAVKRNLDRAATSVRTATSNFAGAVRSVETRGSQEVVISLSRPYPDLPAALAGCTGMIVNPQRLITPEQLATTTDGSGPYDYDAAHSTPGSRYVFHRRKDYWNTAAYPFDNAVFTVITDFGAAYDALAAGRVDVAPGVPAALAQADGAGLGHVQGPADYYMVNLLDRAGARAPALRDVRVRQALNMAIDRAAISTRFFAGTGRPTAQIIAPEMPGYDPGLDDAYPYDPGRARQLLARAGYPDGFTLPVLSTDRFQCDALLQAVADDWAAIGVTVQREVEDYGSYLRTLTSRELPAAVVPVQGSAPYTALAGLFEERSRRNPFRSTDPELGLAFAQARDATDAKASDGLRRASALLVEQAWYAGIGHDTVVWFFDPRKVTGLQMRKGDPVPRFYDWRPVS
ncbi:peptide ABC transporter substrate-binding protein [Kitasatospora sp. NE20-6]|uniref:ABC transporter substrate-binding protein n=1 Tax=Kitasatospora sp. NE20-6 TaxID=2859066 RepID=UPI0034DBDF07